MSTPVKNIPSVFRSSPGNLVMNDIIDNDQRIDNSDSSVKNKSSSTDEVMVFPVASAFGLPHVGNNNSQVLKDKKFIHSSSTPNKLTSNSEVNDQEFIDK